MGDIAIGGVGGHGKHSDRRWRGGLSGELEEFFKVLIFNKYLLEFLSLEVLLIFRTSGDGCFGFLQKFDSD